MWVNYIRFYSQPRTSPEKFYTWKFSDKRHRRFFSTLFKNQVAYNFLEIVQKLWRCSMYQKAIRPQACNYIKIETLAQVFSCKFCEIFIYRSPPDDCLLFESVKTSQQLPQKKFSWIFESGPIFSWKQHYSICVPKNWNILIWFVCHSTE